MSDLMVVPLRHAIELLAMRTQLAFTGENQARVDEGLFSSNRHTCDHHRGHGVVIGGGQPQEKTKRSISRTANRCLKSLAGFTH